MRNISYDLIEKYRQYREKQEASGAGKASKEAGADQVEGNGRVGETETAAAPDENGAAESSGDISASILREMAGAEKTESEYYYALSPARQGLFEWLPIDRNTEVLEIGAAYGAFAGLADRAARFDIKDSLDENLELIKFRYPEKLRSAGGNIELIKSVAVRRYDLILLPMMNTKLPSAYKGSLSDYIKDICKNLKNGGKLALAFDNEDALKFSAGADPDPDSFYGNFGLIETLRRTLPFSSYKTYYPIPDADFPANIFSEERLPEAGDFKDVSESFTSPRFVLCNEEKVYGTLAEAGAFRQFAPSYMIIFTGYDKDRAAAGAENAAAVSGGPSTQYIRYNSARSAEFALRTEIYLKDGVRRVRKTALSKASDAHAASFEKKYKILLDENNSRINVLEPHIGTDAAGRCYAEFDYIEGRDLGRLLADRISDGRIPQQEMKNALELVLGIGERTCHNIDSLLENILVSGGRYYLTDYEWVFENELDREYLKYRILYYFYEAFKGRLYAYGTANAFLKEYGIEGELLEECEVKEASFQEFVHGNGISEIRNSFRKSSRTADEITTISSRLEEFTEWNLRLQDEVEEHKTMLKKEREVERLSQNHIRNIEAINKVQKAELESAQTELEYLRKHQSVLSRIVRKLIAAIDKAAPQGSKKRKLLHYAKNTVKHPVKYLGMYFSKEGRKFIHGDFSIGGEFEEGGMLKLPKTDRPMVSIIIPAYNQVSYTYACVKSILEHTDFELTPYEILLADDVSTDATKEISEYIDGLIICRNAENQGFLKNCNQAAAKATGDFLFFLNNDTKVTDGWLESLVTLIGSDDSIGMVGSKLVYPDGRLQEAGGIIWSDGSGWNYGRLQDPSLPEFNYVKDVDYISGAAIMISRALWMEIGGFDERFAPAYCEDSDLAFEVRKHGKRVVYQPKSVVVHFEGVSNGTDVEGTGLKRYQKINQETFKEKWAEELKKQSVNTGDPDPFAARDRSQGKPCVMVFDHYVPTWDKDAGSRTTYQYLKMFLKKGFNVKFVGDNFRHDEPYSSALEQMGIEILHGAKYQDGIFDYIKQHKSFIDFAYLNRPHIAVKYIDWLKENTDIKCIYYGHDLHYLRLQREYELKEDIRTKRESEYWKGLEFSVMQKADMVYYPSQTEIDAIHLIHPEIPAKAITAYMWDDFEGAAADDETTVDAAAENAASADAAEAAASGAFALEAAAENAVGAGAGAENAAAEGTPLSTDAFISAAAGAGRSSSDAAGASGYVDNAAGRITGSGVGNNAGRTSGRTAARDAIADRNRRRFARENIVIENTRNPGMGLRRLVEETPEKTREGMLFVGGFAHPPNVDGLLWFAEKILPLVREKLPEARLLVAGSNATDEVKELGKKDRLTDILGFVSDNRLLELYEETKLAVVPLRYGAGVKGKVVEALHNRAAIVTTSVGAEGIPGAAEALVIADEDPADIEERSEAVERSFADAIIRLYEDDAKLEEMRRDSYRLAEKQYSLESAWKVVAEDFSTGSSGKDS